MHRSRSPACLKRGLAWKRAGPFVFMKTIACQNRRLGAGGNVRCNRLISLVPEWVLDGLKEHQGSKEEGRLIYICNSCRKGNRIFEIKYVNDKLTFAILKEPLDTSDLAAFEQSAHSEQVA